MGIISEDVRSQLLKIYKAYGADIGGGQGDYEDCESPCCCPFAKVYDAFASEVLVVLGYDAYLGGPTTYPSVAELVTEQKRHKCQHDWVFIGQDSRTTSGMMYEDHRCSKCGSQHYAPSNIRPPRSGWRK